MKKLILMAVVGLTMFSTVLLSQNNKPMNYQDYWKKVEEHDNQGLPKSAAMVVDEIMQKAIAEKNTPQAIKALIFQADYKMVIDSDDDIYIFDNLIEMIDVSTDVVEQSVLHSMLGELYLSYYQGNSWQIDQRTELGDFIPEDMKEWTRNIFYNKTVEHLNASVQEQKELLESDVESYKAVVTLGKSSRILFPTMYDFLSQRRIENFRDLQSDKDLSSIIAVRGIDIKNLFTSIDYFSSIDFNPSSNEYNLWSLLAYKDFVVSLNQRNMSDALIITELDNLNYLRSALPAYYNMYAKDRLEQLLNDNADNPFSVEVVSHLVSMTINNDQQEEYIKETYNLLKEYIAKFPEYDRIGLLKNKLSEITNPRFTISGNKTFALSENKKFDLSYRNISSLKLKVYKLKSHVDVLTYKYNSTKSLIDKAVFVKDIEIELPSENEYQFKEHSFNVDINTPGIYMLSVSDSELFDDGDHNFIFSASDLTVLSRFTAKDMYEFFVLDRTTGKPIEGAKVDIYVLPGNWSTSKLKKIESISTNKMGQATYNKYIPNRDLFYNATMDDDYGSELARLPFSFNITSSENTKSRDIVNIYTDRGIYRPGQTVYFKAIATATDGKEAKLLTDRSIEFALRDVNGREISKQLLSVNEFGSVSGEYALPTNALNGTYTIRCSNGSVYFKVEEYKRPTFDIEFDKIDKTYSFGEEVSVKGRAKSFSGINLQGATVKYRITRQQFLWSIWGGSSQQFDEGITTTNDDGYFEILFTPEKADKGIASRQIYTFNIEARVTDINGETQSSVYTVAVGDVSMLLSLDVKDKLEKSSNDRIVISATNLDGEKIDAKGEYKIYSLLENDSINKEVVSGAFDVGEQKQLKQQLVKLPSGKYRIKLISKDNKGREVVSDNDVVLFSYSDKNPPIKTNEWLVVKNSSFSKSKAAEIILGATDKVNVLYELWQKDNLLEREWIVLNNENRNFSFKYKDIYKDGITLMLNYVKDGKFYSHAINMMPEEEKKTLDITLDTFRDKIRPGAKEEWRISVRDSKGNPTIAEVLASMYDMSLDKLYQTPKWSFNTNVVNSYRSMFALNKDGSEMTNQIIGNSRYKYISYDEFAFDFFNWYGFSLPYGSSRILARSAGVVGEQMMYAAAPKLQNAESQDMRAEEEIMIVAEDDKAEDKQSINDNIRRNFDETAFFYPQLVTNSKGETQIAFTVPDANTKWKLRLLAHDKNLNSGYAEEVTVSQKELMVTPNIPRFVRQGDKTSISTKISNLSEGDINGVVSIEFFNPVNDDKIELATVDSIEQNFFIERDASTEASWMFVVPSDIDIIGVRIVAKSDNFSDGEQHALAVLPNRMMVTESIRMDLNRNEDKSFVFDRLVDKTSNTRQDYRLTLEFTTNPAWYAIQALPVLGAPDNDNSVSWFAAYYANKLGIHIGESYPKVSAMVEAWKKQGGTSETLLSNLEKNEELKSILIEETPWVMESRNESEQKQKLSLLFDINRSDNITNKAVEQLQKLQSPNGGWSWFEGFRPNVGITQYILYGFSQLSQLGIENGTAVEPMIRQALDFVDNEALHRFELLKRNNKSWKDNKYISTVDLEYLLIRNLYSEYKIDNKLSEMTEFYNSVITKYWTRFDLYSLSLISVIMSSKGNDKIVNDIIKSLREHATISNEMGMYWANNRTNVFMSQSAVSVHTFIMEAFKEAGADNNEMDNMKRWLLKQKQTQQWESTHATIDAVYALLSTGSDWFETDGETAITVGGELVEANNKDLGTGYFKESWYKSQIKSVMGNIDVSQRGNTPAWGAMYLQYFEDLDKIEGNDASLDVKKELFIEQTDSNGRRLMRVDSDGGLSVGDKVVVRITVRTDRDMEFVHIKDMRASCFESVNQLSGAKWDEGVIYYQSPKDASTNYYIDILPKGTYVFEYTVVVNRKGEYSNGITTIQSMYAPEFTSHTGGSRINVK